VGQRGDRTGFITLANGRAIRMLEREGCLHTVSAGVAAPGVTARTLNRL
jgi:hypothetical protein